MNATQLDSDLATYVAGEAGKPYVCVSPAAVSVADFVRSHGFACDVHADQVTVHIPYTDREGREGSDAVNVRTLAEARTALGY